MRKILLAGATVAGLTLAAASAQATEFAGTWSITALQTTDPGLIVDTSASGGSFDIPNGVLTPSSPSTTVDLFTLYTDESSVQSDDEHGGQQIAVTFDFTIPAVGSTTISGDTKGQATFFGLVQNGVVTWNNGGVGDFTWGNGGLLTIQLNGGTFDTGIGGLHGGERGGLDVDAKFDWVSDPSGVPEPATWALMIGGFGLAGVSLRRRRAVATAA